MGELLICVTIALAILIIFRILIKFLLWLDDNTDIDFEFATFIIAIFITLTFGVWAVRTCIRENKKAKLERRRI